MRGAKTFPPTFSISFPRLESAKFPLPRFAPHRTLRRPPFSPFLRSPWRRPPDPSPIALETPTAPYAAHPFPCPVIALDAEGLGRLPWRRRPHPSPQPPPPPLLTGTRRQPASPAWPAALFLPIRRPRCLCLHRSCRLEIRHGKSTDLNGNIFQLAGFEQLKHNIKLLAV
ncbi:hypothetical protein Taro_007947 [Colocasia esculenta]|uniref:Uncharacterized protein n=1 Tax=Colocasia esculenta TaxID=4460 RepID=A0A843U1U2_COLES|nr:hypothetical protein [Colocasia esculenta]